MAYVRPLVQVYQEYEAFSGTAQSTTLNPCIVGPCYQVLDESSNLPEKLLLSYFGEATVAGVDVRTVPNIVAGALLVEDTVKLRFTEAYANMGGETPIAVADVTDNVLTFLVGTYPTGIAIGDYVTVVDDDDDSTVNDKLLVIAVDLATYKVTLNKIVGAATTPTAIWLRLIPEFTLTAEDTAITVSVTTNEVTIGAVTQTVGGSSKPIYAAQVNCGYKALRRDVDQIQTADSLAGIEAALGDAIPENPLAFGAMIALANTQYTVYFIGLDSDDLAGYTSAKDLLENAEDIYSVVPLSQDPGILSVFKTHAEAMSQPTIGKWRIAFGNSPLPSVVTISEGTCKVKEDQEEDAKVIYAASSTFLSDEVNSGDTLILSTLAGIEIDTVLVNTTVSEDQLLVSTVIEGATLDTTDYAYKITRVADRTLQAQDIRNTSIAYGSSRFVHVWPDICVIDDEELPGYYLCCAIAGMVSGLASQQGFTRISVAGISAVRNSGDYFNSTQLDTIADGGTFILMQLSSTAPPYVRHQLTTDTSTYEFRELSFVKNFDFVSYICKDVLDAFIGRWNVTVSTMGALETVLTAVLESLKLSTMPKIGAPVIDYEIASLTQLESQKDRVEIYANVEFPYALNMIGLHIVSSDL